MKDTSVNATRIEMARILCGHLQHHGFDSLPVQATYLERKSATHPIVDQFEAMEIISSLIDFLEQDGP